MHQLLLLPPGKPMNSLPNPARAPEQSSEDRKLARLHFVYDIYIESLRGMMTEEKFNELNPEKIKNLWDKIVRIHSARQFFDFDYLYNILRHYFEYRKFTQIQLHAPLVLAILMQRIGGWSTNFRQNAEISRTILTEDFGIYGIPANRVMELINSSIAFSGTSNDYKKNLFRDLQFTRLGIGLMEFVNNQEKIYKERKILTRLQHYQCQYAIFKEILKFPSIFITGYFRERYDLLAQTNIKSYLDILVKKIAVLKVEAARDKRIKDEQEKKENPDIKNDPLESEGYCG